MTQAFRQDVRRSLRDARKEFRKSGADFVPDLEIPFGHVTERASAKIASVPEDDLRALDAMIEQHGLAAIVKTLRELCDTRAPSVYETDMTFETMDREEVWGERAQALEDALARIKA